MIVGDEDTEVVGQMRQIWKQWDEKNVQKCNPVYIK